MIERITTYEYFQLGIIVDILISLGLLLLWFACISDLRLLKKKNGTREEIETAQFSSQLCFAVMIVSLLFGWMIALIALSLAIVLLSIFVLSEFFSALNDTFGDMK